MPIANEPATQPETTLAVRSRHPALSSTRTRKPRARWSASVGDEPPLGRPHSYIVRQVEKCIEPVGPAERGAERQEMQRQEDRERDAGEPVQKRCYKAVLEVCGADHAA